MPDRAPTTLAPAIVRVLTDRELAGQLGRAGREHVLRSFSMAAMAARYEALFAALASASARSRVGARGRSGAKEMTA